MCLQVFTVKYAVIKGCIYRSDLLGHKSDDSHSMTPSARNCSISVVVRPISRSTTSVCSPSRGAGPLTPPGVSSKRDGGRDASVARGIGRVVRQLRAKTSMTQLPGDHPMPKWVGLTPNVFPTPEAPGDIAYTALDASYTMAPYALEPDEALVMTGRFPKCRFSNVVLWNQYQMAYDYAHRQSSLNRAQTTLEPDGSFRMILAHEDPGQPNWIDTEGRLTGTVFWRFFLPEEAPETPAVEVVKLEALRAGS